MQGTEINRTDECREDKYIDNLIDETILKVKGASYWLFVNSLRAIVWVATQQINGITWVIQKIHPYDPKVLEETKCPACGYRGSRLHFVRTVGAEKGAIQHNCNMCSAIFYSPLIVPAEKWLSPNG